MSNVAPTPRRMVLRGALKRCPLCGGGHLFGRWFTMVDRCPTCGHRFERRPHDGFFLGAYVINISLVLTLLAATLFGYGMAVGEVIGGPPSAWVVASVLIAGVLPLVSYPFSKTVWSAIDIAMNPPEPVEQAEAVAWVATHPEPV